MLADPCNCTLVPGIYGSAEGLLARVKSRASFAGPSSSGTAGYILWACDTTGLGPDETQYSPASIVGSRFTDTTSAVLNTIADPAFGQASGTVGGAGFSIVDPAATLLSNGLARDARTLSACMRMTYTGSMAAAAGQLAVIENFPVESLLEGITVDQLFALSGNVSRIGVSSHEVKFRPADSSNYFRPLDDPVTVGTYPEGTTHSAAIETGIAASSPTRVDGHNQGLRLFGFAWSGTSDATALSFEFIKNIEWRPAADSGLPIQRPKTLHSIPPIEEAERALDRANPSWSISNMISEAGHIATQAFSGAAHAVVPALKGAATSYAVGYLEEIASEGALMLL